MTYLIADETGVAFTVSVVAVEESVTPVPAMRPLTASAGPVPAATSDCPPAEVSVVTATGVAATTTSVADDASVMPAPAVIPLTVKLGPAPPTTSDVPPVLASVVAAVAAAEIVNADADETIDTPAPAVMPLIASVGPADVTTSEFVGDELASVVCTALMVMSVSLGVKTTPVPAISPFTVSAGPFTLVTKLVVPALAPTLVRLVVASIDSASSPSTSVIPDPAVMPFIAR